MESRSVVSGHDELPPSYTGAGAHALVLTIAQAAAALGAAEDWQAALPALLATAATDIGVHRMLLYRVEEGEGARPRQTCIADWSAAGLTALAGDRRYVAEALPAQGGPLAAWIGRHRRGGPVEARTADFEGDLRTALERLEIRAFLSVPVMVDDAWWGHLACCDCGSDREWTELERSVLSAVAALVAGAVGREATSRRLAAQEAAGRAIVDHALDAIVTADRHGRVEEFNPAASRIFGLPRQAVIGRPFAEALIPAHLRSAHSEGFERLLAGGPHRILGERVETEAQHADGRIFPVELTVVEVHGGPERRFAAHIRDISERRRAEASLESLAFGDPVTGRLNRAGLLRALGARDDTFMLAAVTLVGLSDTKATFGAAYADRVLRRVSDRLAELAGADHLLARTGDFGLTLAVPAGLGGGARVEAQVPEGLLRALQHALERPVTAKQRILHLDGRCGVAVGAAAVAEEALRNAELAATRATPLSGPVVYTPELRAERLKQLELEAALRAGLADDSQFVVHYQPIVALDRHHIVGFECLLRWRHPQLGMIPPLDFIPLAEATGLIVPLGRLVLEKACRTAASWSLPPASRANVAVNISPVQLSDPGLVDAVAATLDASGLPPGRLKLEITESGVIEASGSAVATLHRLREMGIVLALDDFGTGYSSLAMLRDLPVSILKIDRSFVVGMERGGAGDAVLASIVALADSLRLDTVAEGIESPDEADRLRALGCSHGQGWFFGRPLPAEEVMRVLSAAGGSGT
ncbi:putative bifunctional diguanylate cyclase/phosphodiesterase [Marinibaculum pumilum]|uniref:Bifunctional diguanylate cyclase/phosphodiesterase n=1 Tax=Marinibaculum pumilum TaxID=1766165 RepID=A0ABV7L3I4_9PROT